MPTVDVITEHFLLAAYADPSQFTRIRHFDLSQPPDTYSEAVARSDNSVWHEVMKCEMASIETHDVFEWTTLPPGRKDIGAWWVYAFKFHPDGTVILGKEKARVVAQGFSQCPEDYGSTYVPIAKTTSIQIVLPYAADFDWEIFSFDVKTAFLHAPLTHEIFLTQIPGFLELDLKTVLWLKRVIYGL